MSFEEAAQIFCDPLCLSVRERTVDGEERWQTFGLVDGVALLIAAHTYREVDEAGASVEVIRIISARVATRKERQRYEDENGSI